MKYLITHDQAKALADGLRLMDILRTPESTAGLDLMGQVLHQVMAAPIADDAKPFTPMQLRRGMTAATRLNVHEVEAALKVIWEAPAAGPIQPRTLWIQSRLNSVKALIQAHEDANIPVGENLREEQRELENMLK